MIIALYVDDLLIAGNDTAAILWIKMLEIDISEMRSQDTCNTHVCKLSHSTHM